MRRILTMLCAVAVVTVTSPDLQARAPQRQVQLITGSARISRGRVRRARGAATHRALLEAVWRLVLPRLESTRGKKRLRRQLSRRVRKLIQRYRTRKVSRVGRRLKVLLAVTVDRSALSARLKALKVRLKQPGVLLLTHCEQGPLASAVSAELKSASIRVVTSSLPPDRKAALIRTSQTTPGALRAAALGAHAAAVLVVRCEAKVLSKIVAAKVTGVRSKLVAEAFSVGKAAPVRRLLRLEQWGLAHDADVKRAGYAALARALPALTQRLGRSLPSALPAGLRRTLLVRLRGALGLATLLQFTRQMSGQLAGVAQVTPRKLARGVTWLAVRTVHSPQGLRLALAALRPPVGWRLHLSTGPRPGTLDLRAELHEESP